MFIHFWRAILLTFVAYPESNAFVPQQSITLCNTDAHFFFALARGTHEPARRDIGSQNQSCIHTIIDFSKRLRITPNATHQRMVINKPYPIIPISASRQNYIKFL